jgi:hypothetical protein
MVKELKVKATSHNVTKIIDKISLRCYETHIKNPHSTFDQ